MGYTQVALEGKLVEIYPELEEHGVQLSLSFDAEKNAWVVSLHKDGKSLETFLDKKDADDCIDGIKCVYLGVKIGEFLKNFQEDIA